MITCERHGDVAVLKLDRGITNAINLELVRALADALRTATGDDGARALVLTGSNDKFFSIGFDLPSLVELPRPEMEVFYRAFNQLSLDLYTMPCPTVAAIPGHAVAGGCILAQCCDYRFIAEGRKLMGLNEIKLGLPVPYPSDRMLRELLGSRTARTMLDSGELYPTAQLLELGLVDQVLPPDRLLAEAVSKAAQLGELPRQAFTMIKQNRVEPVVRQVASRLEERQQYFLDCWFRPETLQLLREAAKRF